MNSDAAPDRAATDAATDTLLDTPDATDVDALDAQADALDASTDATTEAALDAPADVAVDVVHVMPTDPPRLIGPPSTATVSSHRPTLRWSLPAGSDGAEVRVCTDRACAHEVAVIRASGERARPDAPLVPGVYFWSARARSGTLVGAPASATWEFVVGVEDAGDTRWGTLPDFDGDGYGDAFICPLSRVTMTTYRAFEYRGSATGLETSPEPGTWSVPYDGSPYVIDCGSAGDLNGDGFADAFMFSRDQLAFFLGGPSGLASTPFATFTDEVGAGTPSRGQVRGHAAGDIDADGYGDFLTGSDQNNADALLRGGPAGLTVARLIIVAHGIDSSIAAAGDLDGDGFDDVLVDHYPQIEVYAGSPTGLAATPQTIPEASPAAYAFAGDMNGDGFLDVVAFYDGMSQGVLFYAGGASGLSATAITPRLPMPPEVSGWSIESAGDTDGDGYADAIMSDYGSDRALLVFGGASLAAPRASVLAGPSGTYFGQSVMATDANRDGFSDVGVQADSIAAMSVEWVYAGGPGGPGAITRLTAP